MINLTQITAIEIQSQIDGSVFLALTKNDNTKKVLKIKGNIANNGAIVTSNDRLSFATETGVSNNFNNATFWNTGSHTGIVQTLALKGKQFWNKT